MFVLFWLISLNKYQMIVMLAEKWLFKMDISVVVKEEIKFEGG